MKRRGIKKQELMAIVM